MLQLSKDENGSNEVAITYSMEKNEKARVIILDSLIPMLAEKRKIIESRQSNK